MNSLLENSPEEILNACSYLVNLGMALTEMHTDIDKLCKYVFVLMRLFVFMF